MTTLSRAYPNAYDPEHGHGQPNLKPGYAMPGVFGKMQLAAETFWLSKFYIPTLMFMAFFLLVTNNALQGCLLIIGFVTVMLIFCQDILSLLLPFLLFCLMTTAFYEDYGQLTQYWWMGIFLIGGLVLHVFLYDAPSRPGKFSGSLLAVSIATLIGGLGVLPFQQYVSGVSLYYCFSLGPGMLLAYTFFRAQLGHRRNYHVGIKFARTLYAAGLFCGAVVLLVYLNQYQTFLTNFATIYFSYRNFCATILLMALPMPCLFIRESSDNWFGMAFLYAMLLMTGSRSGLLFGTLMLGICFIYLYRTNVSKRKIYLKWLKIGAVPMTIVLLVAVKFLFASRMTDGALISMEDSRVTFFLQGLKDFWDYPIFGKGLGCMDNQTIFLGVSGSMVWYHNLFAQVLGSMGLVGAVAYGWQIKDRIQILCRSQNAVGTIFALSYAGIFLISMTNPGEFSPFPNEILVIIMFAVLEETCAAQPAASPRLKMRRHQSALRAGFAGKNPEEDAADN